VYDPTHIAVLYFDVLNDSARLEPVAAGLTEDLIDALERVPTLTVISAAGVRPLRDRTPPTDSVARAFNVGTIVSGRVSRSTSELRVAVRLIDAVSGRQLHSQSFVRAPAELLTLQDSLTEDIAQFLRRQLGEAVALRARRTATRSADAWELVRRSAELQEYARRLSASDGDAARHAFGQADSVAARAAALDPRWVEPVLRRGWIAWSRAVVSTDRGSNAPQSEFMTRINSGLAFAERALAMAPVDGRPLELRGFLRFQQWTLQSEDTRRRAAAEADLRAAVHVDPDRAIAWYALSELLSSKGELAEAEAAARKAYEKDSYLQEAENVLSHLYSATLGRGEFTEAARWCAEGQRRYAENPNFLECRLTLIGWSGKGASDVSAAWREVDRLDTMSAVVEGEPYRLLLVANVLARSGWTDSARSVVRETRRHFPRGDFDLQEASVRLLLGERDATLRLLGAFLRRHPGYRGYVANHFWFHALQSDPRFGRLTAGSGP
jgi:TolB-like protein